MSVILEEETVTETMPPGAKAGLVISSDTTEQHLNSVPGLIWHDIVNLPMILQARVAANPVIPPGINLVRRTKDKDRRVNGIIIGSKCNNVKNASRRRLQKLINEQTDRDRRNEVWGQVSVIIAWKLREPKSYMSFRVPTPKGDVPIPMENIIDHRT